jgi:hypothetical protein
MLPILTTTEQAVESFLTSTLTAGTNIYKGLDNEERQAPCVICSATDARLAEIDSGIWHVRTAITVKEIAYDTATSSTLAGSVVEALEGDLKTNLTNSGTNYAVLDVFLEEASNSIEGDAWVQTIVLDVVCCLTD